ncbi:hypothetical protein BD413DRAFT_611903 [Trametes elegans]|nr:hypothetical protein BD413DRAFT_611903 [Trametes elegans]
MPSQVLRRVALALGLIIAVARVNVLWSHALVRTLSTASTLAFLAIVGRELPHPDMAYHGKSLTLWPTIVIYLATLAFSLGVLGLLRSRRSGRLGTFSSAAAGENARGGVSDIVAETWKIGVVWLSAMIACTLYLSFQHMNPYLRRSLGFVGCLVATHASSREYEKLERIGTLVRFPRSRREWLDIFQRHVPSQPASTNAPGSHFRTSGSPTLSTPTTSAESSTQPPGCVGTAATAAEAFELGALSSDALARRPFIHDPNSPQSSASGSSQSSSSTISGPSFALPPQAHDDGNEG